MCEYSRYVTGLQLGANPGTQHVHRSRKMSKMLEGISGRAPISQGLGPPVSSAVLFGFSNLADDMKILIFSWLTALDLVSFSRTTHASLELTKKGSIVALHFN